MRLLPISGKDMCRMLERLGFKKVHQVGSHVRYIHADGSLSRKSGDFLLLLIAFATIRY